MNIIIVNKIMERGKRMIISGFSDILNLHNWVKGLTISSPININKKSSYFEEDDICGHKTIDCLIDINKMTYYNYIYNYFYFVQEYVRKFEPEFFFGDYANIHEIKYYYDNINSIEAQIFLESVMEEGLENISSFLDNLNMYDYDEDIFYLFKYYNFLIEDTVEHDHISQDVFLIEGMIEPFRKADDFLISKEYTNVSQYNENISLNLDMDDSFEWVVSLEDGDSYIIKEDSVKSAFRQTLII